MKDRRRCGITLTRLSALGFHSSRIHFTTETLPLISMAEDQNSDDEHSYTYIGEINGIVAFIE